MNQKYVFLGGGVVTRGTIINVISVSKIGKEKKVSANSKT